LSARQAGTTWKSILGLCDEAEELRVRSRDASEAGSVRSEMRGLLVKELRTGSLAEISGERRLTLDEAEVVALLLRRYVDPKSPWLTGREVIDRIADDTFSKLRSIGLLGPDGTLRQTGLVSVERPQRGIDPLDARFRLSDAAASLFFDAPQRSTEKKPPRKPQPYLSNREYVLELRALAEYCRRRAHALFGPPDADGYRPSRRERKQIERKLRIIARRVERDLAVTEERERFPMIQFQREMALTAEETLVIVDLLFAHLFEGEPSLEVVELLQMVSRDEEDLLRRRRMFAPESSLVRKGLVVLVDPEEERDPHPRVALAPGVADRILGDDRAGRAIAPDEKIDFHLYLKNLDSSTRFYQDLAGSEDDDEKKDDHPR